MRELHRHCQCDNCSGEDCEPFKESQAEREAALIQRAREEVLAHLIAKLSEAKSQIESSAMGGPITERNRGRIIGILDALIIIGSLRSQPPESCQNCRDEFVHFCEDCPRIEKKHEYTIFGFTRQMLEQHDAALIQRALDKFLKEIKAEDPQHLGYVDMDSIEAAYIGLRQPPTTGSTTSPAKGKEGE